MKDVAVCMIDKTVVFGLAIYIILPIMKNTTGTNVLVGD